MPKQRKYPVYSFNANSFYPCFPTAELEDCGTVCENLSYLVGVKIISNYIFYNFYLLTGFFRKEFRIQ